MPLIKEFYPTNNSVIAIWEQSEPLKILEDIALTDIDKTKYATFKIDKRKKEWLSVRHLLKHLLSSNTFQIVYDKNRKPNLQTSNYNISISHSKHFVAVFLNSNSEVGLDIEEPRSNIISISQKFLSEKELSFLEGTNAIEKATLLWSAKESLYKFYSKRSVDFKKNLKVLEFDYKEKGQLPSKIELQDFEKHLHVNFYNGGDYFLTWVY